MLERTDELIGEIIRDLPANAVIAVVSDHGFERVDRIVNIQAIAGEGVMVAGGVVIATSEVAARKLRELKSDPQNGIGREIPAEDYARFPSSLPAHPAAAFESVEHVMFGYDASGKHFSKPREIGNHGHWPTRYRSVYLIQGPSIPPKRLPEFSIKDIAARLGRVIGVRIE